MWWLCGVRYCQMGAIKVSDVACGALTLWWMCMRSWEYIIPAQPRSHTFLNEREISKATQPWQWINAHFCCPVCVCVCDLGARMSFLSFPCNMSNSNLFSQKHQQKTVTVSQHHTLRAPWRKIAHHIHSYTVIYIDGYAAVTMPSVLKSHGASRQRCVHKLCVYICRSLEKTGVCVSVCDEHQRWRKEGICVHWQCQLSLNYVNNSTWDMWVSPLFKEYSILYVLNWRAAHIV